MVAVAPGADYAKLAFLRATIMLWTLADPTGAKNCIDDASHTVPAEARGFIDAFLTVYWAVMGNPEMARESSDDIDLNRLPDVASTSAAWAITFSSGDAGRTTEAIAAADAGYEIATRAVDAASAYARFAVVDARVSCLLQSGRIAEASDAAERLGQEATDLGAGGKLRAAAVAGRAALGAGHLDKACALLEPVAELLSSGETNGWGYRYQIPRTIALAMRGATDQTAAAMIALESQRHPSWRMLDYEHSHAHAWVAACRGETCVRRLRSC